MWASSFLLLLSFRHGVWGFQFSLSCLTFTFWYMEFKTWASWFSLSIRNQVSHSRSSRNHWPSLSLTLFHFQIKIHAWFNSVNWRRMEAGRVKPPFEPDPHAVYAKVKSFTKYKGKIISEPHAVYAKVKTFTKIYLIQRQKSYHTRTQSMPR